MKYCILQDINWKTIVNIKVWIDIFVKILTYLETFLHLKKCKIIFRRSIDENIDQYFYIIAFQFISCSMQYNISFCNISLIFLQYMQATKALKIRVGRYLYLVFCPILEKHWWRNNKKYIATVKKNRGHLGSVGLDSPYSQGGMDSPLLDLEKEKF